MVAAGATSGWADSITLPEPIVTAISQDPITLVLGANGNRSSDMYGSGFAYAQTGDETSGPTMLATASNEPLGDWSASASITYYFTDRFSSRQGGGDEASIP
jgi:hypothetical protein